MNTAVRLTVRLRIILHHLFLIFSFQESRKLKVTKQTRLSQLEEEQTIVCVCVLCFLTCNLKHQQQEWRHLNPHDCSHRTSLSVSLYSLLSHSQMRQSQTWTQLQLPAHFLISGLLFITCSELIYFTAFKCYCPPSLFIHKMNNWAFNKNVCWCPQWNMLILQQTPLQQLDNDTDKMC